MGSKLEETSIYGEAGNQILIHGLKVQVKGRTLKRPTSVLKHARFLNNMTVTPILPEPKVVEEKPQEEDPEEDD